MTRGSAIVMAKLRHCAKFRCTGVLRRIVDGVFGRGGKERKGNLFDEKGGQKSERPNHPRLSTRDGERKKEKDETAVVEVGGTVCCATGSGSSCRRPRK